MAEGDELGIVRVYLEGRGTVVVDGVSKVECGPSRVVLFWETTRYLPKIKAVFRAVGFVVESGTVEVEMRP